MTRTWWERTISWKARAIAVLLALSCQLLFGAAESAAQGAEADDDDEGAALEQVLELGASYAWHGSGLGHGDYEFAAYTMERENTFIWNLEVGHAARFGDSGFGFSTSLSRYLAEEFFVLIGYGSGTGEYEVFPKYRWDAGVGRAFLGKDTLLVSLIYTREQSRIANYYDGFGVELEYYAGPHWIAEAFARYEVGYPGRTTSPNGGIGLTYSVWKKWALGGAVELGSVAYEVIDPEEPLVDYERIAFMAHYQRYVKADFGFNTQVEYEYNDLYDLFAITASVFKEW
jgi:YaiO family outer membrane protein